MDRIGRVLIADDNEDILFAAKLLLEKHVAEVHTTTDPESIPDLMWRQRFDLILLDMNFTRDVTSGQEGFDWLARILELDPFVVVIMITAYADVDMAVKAIKSGATDFVVKPWENEKLIATVSAALRLSRSRREVQDLRSRQERLTADINLPFQDFVGDSPAIQRVRDIINKVAPTDANVLITGESGTGKELVARALHRESNRSSEAFISVDVAALSGSLFESELFGHVKGAFTDAKEDRAGRFELASKGTLLLDEIGNLPLALQAKLLAVIQTRRVTRVGSNHPHDVDVRLICATNMSLPDMIERGEFRQDLLYRINTVEIELPALRERVDDIPLLAHHFLRIYARKYRKQAGGINQASLNKLKAYHWPGNVRELQHSIERAVIMSSSPTLRPSDLQLPTSTAATALSIDRTYQLEKIEELTIRRAMADFGGNVSRVARELGISRPALYRRLERYGLI